MLQEKSDNELVTGVRKGNQDCFEELISRYSNKAFSMAARLTRSADDAEEVIQDVFVTVFRKISSFEGKSSFSSWLYRITFNAALMKLRKKKQNHTVLAEDMSAGHKEIINNQKAENSEGDALTLRSQISQVLEEAIEKLPDEYRPVFILRDIDGLSSREVGKILDLTIPAVKSRLHRSRLMLRRKLLRFYRELTSGESTPAKKVGNL
jgi:RNA polymerase sigma-70 factor (ECF subfamily)